VTEYESALLSASIQDPGVIDRIDIGEELFPDPKARRLFATIRDIHGAGQPVNFLTISDALGSAMADVIGYEALTRLTDSPTAANAYFYVSRLRDGVTRRKLRELSANIEKWVQGKAEDASDIVVKIEKAVEEIGRKSRRLDGGRGAGGSHGDRCGREAVYGEQGRAEWGRERFSVAGRDYGRIPAGGDYPCRRSYERRQDGARRVHDRKAIEGGDTDRPCDAGNVNGAGVE